MHYAKWQEDRKSVAAGSFGDPLPPLRKLERRSISCCVLDLSPTLIQGIKSLEKSLSLGHCLAMKS